MEELLAYLNSLVPGPVADADLVAGLLAPCWHSFQGGHDHGMKDWKLHGRMEDVFWNPPILSFAIERHGGTVLGSTRADLHRWTLDVRARTAACWVTGHRQIRPMAPRLDVRPIAKNLAQSIIARREDNRIKWNRDGSVRILIGNIIPSDGIAKQTLQGRRKRFRQIVESMMTAEGWQQVRTNVYLELRRKSEASSPYERSLE